MHVKTEGEKDQSSMSLIRRPPCIFPPLLPAYQTARNGSTFKRINISLSSNRLSSLHPSFVIFGARARDSAGLPHVLPPAAMLLHSPHLPLPKGRDGACPPPPFPFVPRCLRGTHRTVRPPGTVVSVQGPAGPALLWGLRGGGRGAGARPSSFPSPAPPSQTRKCMQRFVRCCSGTRRVPACLAARAPSPMPPPGLASRSLPRTVPEPRPVGEQPSSAPPQLLCRLIHRAARLNSDQTALAKPA